MMVGVAFQALRTSDRGRGGGIDAWEIGVVIGSDFNFWCGMLKCKPEVENWQFMGPGKVGIKLKNTKNDI